MPRVLWWGPHSGLRVSRSWPFPLSPRVNLSACSSCLEPCGSRLVPCGSCFATGVPASRSDSRALRPVLAVHGSFLVPHVPARASRLVRAARACDSRPGLRVSRFVSQVFQLFPTPRIPASASRTSCVGTAACACCPRLVSRASHPYLVARVCGSPPIPCSMVRLFHVSRSVRAVRALCLAAAVLALRSDFHVSWPVLAVRGLFLMPRDLRGGPRSPRARVMTHLPCLVWPFPMPRLPAFRILCPVRAIRGPCLLPITHFSRLALRVRALQSCLASRPLPCSSSPMSCGPCSRPVPRALLVPHALRFVPRVSRFAGRFLRPALLSCVSRFAGRSFRPAPLPCVPPPTSLGPLPLPRIPASAFRVRALGDYRRAACDDLRLVFTQCACQTSPRRLR